MPRQRAGSFGSTVASTPIDEKRPGTVERSAARRLTKKGTVRRETESLRFPPVAAHPPPSDPGTSFMQWPRESCTFHTGVGVPLFMFSVNLRRTAR